MSVPETMNMPLWFSNFVFWSAQAALLVVAAGFLPHLFQIRQPRVLLGYWRALLAIAFALPWVQPWHRVHSIGGIALAPDAAGSSFTPASDSAVIPWHFSGLQALAQIVGAVILIGIAVRLAILALGLLKLRQFRRASLPVSLSSAAAVFEEMGAQVNVCAEFRLSSDVDSPVTFGLMAPVILLPERFLSMNARYQAAIACHELVHVRRHDWAHQLAEETIRAAFWFHPAIAWLIARVRLAREQVVDLEVVRLTQARKTYLEALLDFATGRSCTAAIPAPPFLAERQLADRVALMFKEVRMSRTRLIVSLAVMACCLALAATLAARAFPLKGSPLAVESAPKGGVAQGVSGGATGGVAQGVSGGVSGGISGGIGGGVNQGAPQGPPSVETADFWIGTVEKGPMVRRVRGLGTLVRTEGSANLVARVMLPEVMTAEVKLNQNAEVDTHNGFVKGHVSRISPSPSNGTRSVDIALDEALPAGAIADLQVDGTIEIEKLDNVIYVGRPAFGAENTSTSMFKLVHDGKEAVRVTVKLGRASVSTIEILEGLRVGDKVILSDMSRWEGVDRIILIK
jgi:beta-lactamase regulating signal transducer with metallopeptidase domain